jgi:hypothetical protein
MRRWLTSFPEAARSGARRHRVVTLSAVLTWMPWSGTGRVERSWQLRRDETSHLSGWHGEVAIRVESGLVVVTREGDPEDHVLRAGEAVVLPPRGKVVAWALQPARATVRRAA